MNPEIQAAKLLLKKGVRVPIPAPLLLRLIGVKSLKFTIKAPTAFQLIRVSELYLSMKIDDKVEISTNEAMEIYKKHGLTMAKIAAVGMLQSRARTWQINWLAKKITKHLAADEVVWIYHLMVLHSGIQDFTITIKSIGHTRLTKPMNLSPEEKTS